MSSDLFAQEGARKRRLKKYERLLKEDQRLRNWTHAREQKKMNGLKRKHKRSFSAFKGQKKTSSPAQLRRRHRRSQKELKRYYAAYRQ
ncbi:hypothetical protein [Persicobacter diffluens]|uniref:Uncharacterized protein n=1 Tax=Persicobacter diffluens TaxID=981 RepID=A0AAN5ANP7_9BACT|nr:hypothetical protein PEDI_41030 [Persicobacter diffluens]